MYINGKPYAVTSYPSKYVEFLKERHGFASGNEVLEYFSENGLEPHDVPNDAVAIGWGQLLVFPKNEEPKSVYRLCIGDAWNEIAFKADGTVYFENETDESDEVARKINYCRQMFRDTFDISGWSAETPEPALTKYFIGFYDERDMMAFKLAFDLN